MEIAGYSGLELLGRGGFSTVYRAHQSAHSRDVAIKVLSVDVSDPAARARFERECAANGRLGSHPNVLTIFESGYTSDGKPYIAMELCSGGSLADQLSAGPMPVEAVLRIGIRVAGAVETAHRSGITHRDIKPENILTTAYGEHVLADFGISVLDNTRTGTATAGSFTLSHVPPEVLQGEVSGVAGDVYALGSTLYRLLTGKPPFADESTPLAVAISRTLNDPLPDPGPHVPASLRAALEASMAKDPSRRPASALALAAMLGDVQRELGGTVVEPVVASIAAAGPVPDAPPVPREKVAQPTIRPELTDQPTSRPEPVPQTGSAGSTGFDPAPIAQQSDTSEARPSRVNVSDARGPADDRKRRTPAIVGACAAALALVVGGIVVAGGGKDSGEGAPVEVVDSSAPSDTATDDTEAPVSVSSIPSTTAAGSGGGKATGTGSKTPSKPTVPKVTTIAPKATSAPVASAAPSASVEGTTTTSPAVEATTTTVKSGVVPTISIPNLTVLGCLTRETCAQALYDAWKANDVTAARKAAILTNNAYPAVTSMFAYPYATHGGGWPVKVTKVSAQVYQVTSTRSATPKSWTFLFNYDSSSYKVALVAAG